MAWPTMLPTTRPGQYKLSWKTMLRPTTASSVAAQPAPARNGRRGRSQRVAASTITASPSGIIRSGAGPIDAHGSGCSELRRTRWHRDHQQRQHGRERRPSGSAPIDQEHGGQPSERRGEVAHHNGVGEARGAVRQVGGHHEGGADGEHEQGASSSVRIGAAKREGPGQPPCPDHGGDGDHGEPGGGNYADPARVNDDEPAVEPAHALHDGSARNIAVKASAIGATMAASGKPDRQCRRRRHRPASGMLGDAHGARRLGRDRTGSGSRSGPWSRPRSRRRRSERNAEQPQTERDASRRSARTTGVAATVDRLRGGGLAQHDPARVPHREGQTWQESRATCVLVTKYDACLPFASKLYRRVRCR